VRQLEIKVLNIIDARCNHESCPNIIGKFGWISKSVVTNWIQAGWLGVY